MSRPTIVINRLDAERLQRLIDAATDKDQEVAEVLERELERGEIVDPEEMPADVVTMNSQVQFTDLTREKQLIRTLVYPRSLADTPDGLSVMAPIGAALLGLREGDVIDWALPGGSPARLRIDAVLWQPEREKQFHR
ncbi:MULTISPECIES: nucleoside diphosphate kinase regulator [Halomonadaceae]|uniref:nucleoside diphosphate kinase regulator n=1 Tax=Halomonadaceae TaxID=28256 RepID=UPI00159794B1|nr:MULTISPECIES: nucleoside diphosphate kinase regulator [Halomonas]QJQ96277.1 nucleoside diphosphate kinase regulator [Halomonas sp. PA5]